MLFQQNISLKSYNTFGIVAQSSYFTTIRNLTEIDTVLRSPTFNLGNPFLIMGGGSNILFRGDFEGLIMKIDLKGIHLIKEDTDYVWVKAYAGENWHDFVTYTLNYGWGGLENLSLIPGHVGASPVQNIGAYGVELQDVVHTVDAYDTRTYTIKEFTADDCAFDYRSSLFKRNTSTQYIITAVSFKLTKRNHQLHLTYGSIGDEIERERIKNITPQTISQAVMAIRRRKLPDPAILGNSGSFFKNPIIDLAHYNLLKTQFPTIASYPLDEYTVKLSAGWLIEKIGWKGKRIGAVGTYSKQALILVNYGNATGDDVYNFSEQIIALVQCQFGILLEREVNVV